MPPASPVGSWPGRGRGLIVAAGTGRRACPGTVSGVVAELGYGTTGLTVGQRVFGLADWSRDGTVAQ